MCFCIEMTLCIFWAAFLLAPFFSCPGSFSKTITALTNSLILPPLFPKTSLQSRDKIYIKILCPLSAVLHCCGHECCSGPVWKVDVLAHFSVHLSKLSEYLQCEEIILLCESHFATLTAVKILETSCSDRMSRGTGCWSKKFLSNRGRSHTPFQLWVPLWASLQLLTAENANCSQKEVKNLSKWVRHSWFLLEEFEVLALAILYHQKIHIWIQKSGD